MKKRRKAGIWLLVILLVLTQISFPGAKVQVNAGSAAVESVENSEEKRKLWFIVLILHNRLAFIKVILLD